MSQTTIKRQKLADGRAKPVRGSSPVNGRTPSGPASGLPKSSNVQATPPVSHVTTGSRRAEGYASPGWVGPRTIDDAAHKVTGRNELHCEFAPSRQHDEIVWCEFDGIGPGAGVEPGQGWSDQAGELPAPAEHRWRRRWWCYVSRDATDGGGKLPSCLDHSDPAPTMIRAILKGACSSML